MPDTNRPADLLRATAPVWFRIDQPDGSRVVGVVQGSAGPLAGEGALAQLHRAQRQARRGRPLPTYEPKPGHVLVFPDYSAASNGPGVEVPIAGATFWSLSDRTVATLRARKGQVAA